jgi:glycosyltransferase involved in cell wall biosynthesis
VVAISVIIAAYNAEQYIRESVESVLSQSFTDFELIVVDDHSGDSTPDVLASFTDPRLRLIRNPANLGVVGARNRGVAEARGAYIAILDADDICIATRFAKQKAVLDAHPEIALVCTASFFLENGVVSDDETHQWTEQTDPTVIRWMLLLENPLTQSSFMFRSELLARLNPYLREQFKYAEDFDFAHRVLYFGDISVIPDRLVIYRRTQNSISRVHREEAADKVGVVLEAVHARMLGGDGLTGFDLVRRHMCERKPVDQLENLYALGTYLKRLVEAFSVKHELSDAQRVEVERHVCRIWWNVLIRTLRAGYFPALAHSRDAFPVAKRYPIPLMRVSRSILAWLYFRFRDAI